MTTKDIKLNFINQSDDVNNSSVVIFQQNAATAFSEIAVAWKVIENCGRGDNHPFIYSEQIKVGASDRYENYTPVITANNGQAFEMIKSGSGDILQVSQTPAASPNEVEIRNNLTQGAINARVYRSGSLCAVEPNLTPTQKAAFEFHPSIYIGAVSQIKEGGIMYSAVLQQVNTQLNLFGIHSADIVMTGGGSGTNAQPFQFQMQNIA